MTVGGLATFNNNIALAGADRTIINTSNNALSLGTNNLTRLTIASGGNVGIGTTTTPVQKLEVNGNIAIGLTATGQFIDICNGTTDIQRLRLSTSGTDTLITATRASGAVPNILFRIDSNEAMRISAGRLIGINEASPSAQLQVKSNATDRVGLIVDTLASQTANLQEWKVNGSILSRIASGGSFISSATIFATSGLANGSTGNNSIFVPSATGALITRNIADANPALIVNQINSSSTGDILRLQKAGTTLGVFTHEGRLGIGTATPDRPLHVVGNARIEGNLTINGSVTQVNTNVSNTEQLSITNDGTGPAIIANQLGAQPVVDFQDDGVSAFYIADGGNVGIGTTAPAAKLDVKSTQVTFRDSTTTTTRFDFETGVDAPRMTFYNANTRNFEIAYRGNNAPGDKNIATIGVITNNPLSFLTNSTERMRILADGKVGINTSAPANPLTILSPTNSVTTMELHRNTITNGDFVGIGFRVTNDVPTLAKASITFLRTAGNSRGDLLFLNSDSATSDQVSLANERMRITRTGLVGIGTNTPTEILDVAGTIKAASIKINDTHFQDTATVTTTATTQTVLATFAAATYGSGKFFIQATQGTDRQISELLVTHNGTTSTATEYGIVKTGSTLYNVTVDINSGNVRLLVTSTSATSTVYRTSFTLIGV
jgi:hypothetical protein